MRSLPLVTGIIHESALDAALRAVLGSKFRGISTYGPDRPVVAWLEDSADTADEGIAVGIATNHDPVLLQVDQQAIKADGVEIATVTVIAPNVNAAPVNLLVNGQAVPVELTNGIGTVEIASLDPTTISVVVQSPANRTTDSVEIKAI